MFVRGTNVTREMVHLVDSLVIRPSIVLAIARIEMHDGDTRTKSSVPHYDYGHSECEVLEA
jgi:hypothetical protein